MKQGSDPGGMATSFEDYNDLAEEPILAENEDAFGFLPTAWRITNQNFEIVPFGDFEERKNCFDALLIKSSSRKILYPPTVETWRSRDFNSYERVPGTKRPADLYPPALSHKLIFRNGENAKEARGRDSMFLLQFLSYLSGMRLQFCGWFLDTRIIPKPTGLSFVLPEKELEPLISKAVGFHRSLNADRALRVTNMLYLHARSRHCFWDWECFTQQFMVLDAVRQDLQTVKGWNSKPRIEKTCQEFGIPCDTNLAKRIIDFRNELFHEGLWAESMPGYGGTGNHTEATLHLRALNERFLAGLLDIGSTFRQSVWWDRQMRLLHDD